jgi:hypothetical protein
MTPRLLPLLAALAVGAVGCGSDQFTPVSGTVTLDGQPLRNAGVNFQPVRSEGKGNPGPGSAAFTDENGHYTLKVVGTETRGAVVGKHKVQITLRQKGPKPLPAKYYGKNTILEFDVPAGGTESADFRLTSK